MKKKPKARTPEEEKVVRHRHEREAEGSVAGALAGSTIGALAGPPGAVAGAFVGAAAGAAVGGLLAKNAEDRVALEKELDEEEAPKGSRGNGG
jgi:phage tail tape-measure protein